MKNLFAVAILVCTCITSSFAITVTDTLFINSGTYQAVDESFFTYKSFNSSENFEALNTRFHLNIGDSLSLLLINTDSINHGFTIQQRLMEVNPGDSSLFGYRFDEEGVFPYYDHLNFPNEKSLGLAGMIIVDTGTAIPFYWNLKEHQTAFCDSINGGNVITDWTNYYPDFFTINGNSNPHINEDPAARIIGSVGDTIRMYIANTGQGIHSLHYHGYHSTIIYSSKHPNHIGRSKDTFAVLPMETLILELVPDQVGEYPVHDHNLVAVSGGKVYPNGMFLTILIE